MRKMKDFQIFTCPFCSCEFYDSTARDGKKVGDPMIECPQCGRKSYRSTILEPALISANRYFDIRFSSRYGNMRIGLILIFAVFLFLILVKRELLLGVLLVGIAVALYTIYELVRVAHRNSYLNSYEYEREIDNSMERLSDEAYAKMVIASQGIDEKSVYYYELYNSDDDGKDMLL